MAKHQIFLMHGSLSPQKWANLKLAAKEFREAGGLFEEPLSEAEGVEPRVAAGVGHASGTSSARAVAMGVATSTETAGAVGWSRTHAVITSYERPPGEGALRWLFPRSQHEAIGDLGEMYYEEAAEHGYRQAAILYWSQVIRSIVPARGGWIAAALGWLFGRFGS